MVDRMRSVLFAIGITVVIGLPAAAETGTSLPPRFVGGTASIDNGSGQLHVASVARLEPAATLDPAPVAARGSADLMNRWNSNAPSGSPRMDGFVRPLGVTVALRGGGGEVSAASVEQVPSRILSIHEGGTLFLATSVKVVSAERVRMHLTDLDLANDARLYVWSDQTRPIAFTAELAHGSDEIWTPSVEGDRIYLEIATRDLGPRTGVTIDSVVQLFGMPAVPDSNTCLLSAICIDSGTFNGIANVRAAVGVMDYVSGGNSYWCTGTLINADNSLKPYFLTSRQCVASQSVASTVQTYFDYHESACGNSTLPSWSSLPQAIGSTLIASSSTTDFTLLQLGSLPPNRWLLGWTTRTSDVPNGTLIYHVTHPENISNGNIFAQVYTTSFVDSFAAQCSNTPRPYYLYSDPSQSGLDPGSTGGPAMISGGYIVGQWYGRCGGDINNPCDNSGEWVDGAFSQTGQLYLQNILVASGASTCTPDATTACMLSNRFRVTVRYRNAFDNGAADTQAPLKPVTGFANTNYETAFFYFNSSNNIEMMIKMLDQGNTNGQGQPTIAVLFGTATPLRIEMTITDTTNGATKTYTSQFGSQVGQTDFTAFVK